MSGRSAQKPLRDDPADFQSLRLPAGDNPSRAFLKPILNFFHFPLEGIRMGHPVKDYAEDLREEDRGGASVESPLIRIGQNLSTLLASGVLRLLFWSMMASTNSETKAAMNEVAIPNDASLF